MISISKILLIGTTFILFVLRTYGNFIVRSPPQLQELFLKKYPSSNGSIPYSIANYGDVPYGKALTAQISIPSILENCIYEQIDTSSPNTAFFVLSERKDCSFTQKSLNAQKQGALLTIIMDNLVENPGQIIMIDDGRGSSVHIPTVLISQDDGDKILEFIIRNITVTSTISFSTNKNKTVVINLWLDSSDRKNYVFIRKFRSYFSRIQDYVKMNVYYGTTPCSKCSPTNCFYSNKYCKIPLNHWGVEDIGQAIIRQQIRQKVIYDTYPGLWWDYMDQFDDQCNDWAVVERCSQKIMIKLKIDSQNVFKEVHDSFKNSTNKYLEDNDVLQKQNSIYYYPEPIINGVPYRGNKQPIDVFLLICNSLDPMPDSCDLSPPQPKPPNIWGWVIFGCIAFILFLVFILICYRKIVRRQVSRDINQQVNELVNQYITMYENQNFQKQQHQQQLK